MMRTIRILTALVFFIALQTTAWAYRSPNADRINNEEKIKALNATLNSQDAQYAESEARQRKDVRGLEHKNQVRHQQAKTPPGALELKEIISDELTGNLQSEAAIAAAVTKYLTNKSQLFAGIKPDQLALKYQSTLPVGENKPKTTYVQFVQQQQGIDVEGSYLRVTVTTFRNKTRVIAISGRLYPELVKQARPIAQNVTERVREAVAKARNISPAAAKIKQDRVRWRYKDGRWRRVRELWLAGEALKDVVDEDTLEAWTEDDRLYETWGFVPGRVLLSVPWEAPAPVRLKDLRVVTSNGLDAYTDENGVYRFPNQPSTTLITARPEGRWASVEDPLGNSIIHAAPAINGVNLVLPLVDEEFNTAQATVYYHAGVIHDWVRSKFPQQSAAIDISLPVTVNYPESCNAHYQRNPVVRELGFYASGDGCVNTAFSTVIYHEYGHFLDDMAGGINDEGLSEGWGDVLAALVSGQPVNGQGFFGSNTSFVRTADNDYQYPSNGMDEVHALGQAWSGFAWHLRQRLGAAVAEPLIMASLFADAASIPEAVSDVLVADDDDGELSNGTPHIRDIAQAARQHQLPIEDYVTLSLFRAETINSVPLKIDIYGNLGAAIQNYTVSYGLGTRPPAWVPITAGSAKPASIFKKTFFGTWDISNLPIGTYTVKLEVSALGTSFQDYYAFSLERNISTVENNGKRQRNPLISQDRVTWFEGAGSKPALFTRKLSTTAGAQLLKDNFLYAPIRIAIDGDRIIWPDCRSNVGGLICPKDRDDLKSYDALTNQYTWVTNTPDKSVYAPSLSGQMLVFNSDEGGLSQSDIRLKDLSSGNSAITLSGSSANERWPVIKGYKVVYSKKVHGRWDLFVKDINTGVVKQITPPAANITGYISDVSLPYEYDFDGKWVVWEDIRSGHVDIYAMDITGPFVEQLVVSGPEDHGYPAVSDGVVVWEDNRYGNWDIFSKNISSGVIQQITANGADQTQPKISGNRIVWVDEQDIESTVKIYEPTCYILTASFGNRDHQAIQTLWQWHHHLVGKHWDAPWHQAYMRWYDQVGPRVAFWVQNKPWVRAAIRRTADWIASIIRYKQAADQGMGR